MSDPNADASSSSAPTASATPSSEPDAPVLSAGEWKVKNVTVEDRVDGLKGPGAGAEARDLIIGMVKDYGFNEQSIKYDEKGGKTESKAWMLGARKHMTSDAATDWTRTVAAYFREKKRTGTDAYNDMTSLTLYGLYNSSMRPIDPSTPIMFDMMVKSVDVDLGSDGRIWVTVNSTATFNFVNDGKDQVSRGDRKQEFWLEEVGGEYKIDGWKGTIAFDVL